MPPKKADMEDLTGDYRSKINTYNGGPGFRKWQQSAKFTLKALGLWEVATGKDLEPTGDEASNIKVADVEKAQAKWESKNIKALDLLYHSLGEDILPELADDATAFDLWDLLQNEYGKNTKSDIASIVRKLCDRKLKQDEPMHKYLTEMVELYNHINNFEKDSFPESLFIILICTGVGPEYSPTTQMIMNDDEKTLSQIKNMLLNAETTIVSRRTTIPRDAVAFNTRTSGNTQQGNNQPAQQPGQKQRSKCEHCGKLSHNPDRCWELPQNAGNRPANWKSVKKDDQQQLANAALDPTVSFGDVVKAMSAQVIVPQEEQHKTEGPTVQAHSATSTSDTIIDSGASCHLLLDPQCFQLTLPTGKRVQTCEDGRLMVPRGEGTAKVIVNDTKCILEEALLIHGLSLNLISLGRIQRAGGSYHSDGNDKMIIHTAEGSFAAMLGQDNLYHVISRAAEGSTPAAEKAMSTKTVKTLEEWHQRLGHLGAEALQNTLKHYGITCPLEDIHCRDCELAKSKKDSYPERTHKLATVPLGRVHSDVCGPFSAPSISGCRFFMTFLDEYTNMCWAIPMLTKGRVPECIEMWINMVENQANHKVKIFRTDNGGEYVNLRLQQYFRAKGILHDRTSPHCPEQNGKAERLNQTLVSMTRTWLIGSKLAKSVWAELIITACWVRNRIYTNVIGDVPLTRWQDGRKADITHMLPVGPCYVHEMTTRDKLDARAREGVLIGYADSRTYRVLIGDKVITSRHVKPKPNTQNGVIEDEHVHSDLIDLEDEDSITNQEEAGEDPTLTNITFSALMSKTDEASAAIANTQSVTTKIAYEELTEACHLSAVPSPECELGPNLTNGHREPTTYFEALNGANNKEWEAAIKNEISSLVKNNTWEPTQLPKGRTPITTKWVFKAKRDETGRVVKYKARLVVRGFSQIPGVDFHETQSPTSRQTTFRFLIAMATQMGLLLHHFDVETAFLHGRCKENVYLAQPEGFKDGTGNVFRLNKSLYGLRQAPRAWHERLCEVLGKAGFTESLVDPCLFERNRPGQPKALMLVYVDDLIIAAKSKSAIQDILGSMRAEFITKDLGPLRWYLGIRVDYNHAKGLASLCQESYINDVVTRFGLTDAVPASTPMVTSFADTDFEESPPAGDVPYAQAIGSLLYISLGTRPDITNPVQRLSKFTHSPKQAHWEAVKRVIRYLKGTSTVGIHYTNEQNKSFTGYTDADHASLQEERHSISGYMFIFAGGPVSWASKRQTKLAASTQESELHAVFIGTKEAIWLTLFSHLEITKQELTLKPITVLCDNQGALSYIETQSRLHERTKHYDIELKWLQKIDSTKARFEYVPTERQLADLLTKPLTEKRFEELKTSAGIREC